MKRCNFYAVPGPDERSLLVYREGTDEEVAVFIFNSPEMMEEHVRWMAERGAARERGMLS